MQVFAIFPFSYRHIPALSFIYIFPKHLHTCTTPPKTFKKSKAGQGVCGCASLRASPVQLYECCTLQGNTSFSSSTRTTIDRGGYFDDLTQIALSPARSSCPFCPCRAGFLPGEDENRSAVRTQKAGRRMPGPGRNTSLRRTALKEIPAGTYTAYAEHMPGRSTEHMENRDRNMNQDGNEEEETIECSGSVVIDSFGS